MYFDYLFGIKRHLLTFSASVRCVSLYAGRHHQLHLLPTMTSESKSNGYGHTNGISNDTMNGASHNGSGSHSQRAQTSRPRDPIAIVGISAKFGGSATNASKLWDMIAGGETAWSPIPKERFDVKSFYHPDKDRLGRVSAFTYGLIHLWFWIANDPVRPTEPCLRWTLSERRHWIV